MTCASTWVKQSKVMPQSHYLSFFSLDKGGKSPAYSLKTLKILKVLTS